MKDNDKLKLAIFVLASLLLYAYAFAIWIVLKHPDISPPLRQIVPLVMRGEFQLSVVVAFATQIITTVIISTWLENNALKAITQIHEQKSAELSKQIFYALTSHEHTAEYLETVRESCLTIPFMREGLHARYTIKKHSDDVAELSMGLSYRIYNVSNKPVMYTPKAVFMKQFKSRPAPPNDLLEWKINGEHADAKELKTQLAQQALLTDDYYSITLKDMKIHPGKFLDVQITLKTYHSQESDDNFVCMHPTDGMEVDVFCGDYLVELASIAAEEFSARNELSRSDGSYSWKYERHTLPSHGFLLSWRPKGSTEPPADKIAAPRVAPEVTPL